MRISGIEPSSGILSQRKWLQKLKYNTPKVPKEAKTKRDGVINPRNYNFSQFYTENFDALKTLQISRSRPLNLATCALGDAFVNQQDTHQVVTE